MKLPVVSGSEAVRAFRKVGYEFDEQHGSHMILRHADPPHRRLSLADHRNWPKELFERRFERPDSRWKSSRDFFRIAARHVSGGS